MIMVMDNGSDSVRVGAAVRLRNHKLRYLRLNGDIQEPRLSVFICHQTDWFVARQGHGDTRALDSYYTREFRSGNSCVASEVVDLNSALSSILIANASTLVWLTLCRERRRGFLDLDDAIRMAWV